MMPNPEPQNHILFVLRPPVENYPPTLNQLAILVEHDFQITVLCAPSGAMGAARDEVPRAVRRIDIAPPTQGSGLPTRMLGLLRFQRTVRHWITKLRPDVVIACDAEAAWAVGARRGPDARLVWHFHELPEPQDQGFSVNLANRWVWRHGRRPDLIVFPDPGRAAVFAKDARIPLEPIQIVANCPRPMLESPLPTLRKALGEQLPAGCRVVLYHGPVGPDHGLETAIRSMRYWPDDVCFVLKGRVQPAFGTNLQALARDEGMADRVLIHSPGFQGYVDHLAFIAGADLGWTALVPVGRNWQYSAYASNKRFECMALGVPQVTDRGPMLPELIEGGGCGVCVPLDDPREVGRAIAAVLTDPNRLAAMGVAGRQLHLQQYNYDRQFEPVLRWLLPGACPTKVHEGDGF